MSYLQCYVSYDGLQRSYYCLLKLVERVISECILHLRNPSTCLDESGKNQIKEDDVFIIFGTKLYFSSSSGKEELDLAFDYNRPILFLKFPDIDELLISDPFNLTHEEKKTKDLIEKVKGSEECSLPHELIYYKEWTQKMVDDIKIKIKKVANNKPIGGRHTNIYFSFAREDSLQAKNLFPLFAENITILSKWEAQDDFYYLQNRQLHTEIEKRIYNSDIFIIHLTENYISSDITKNEIDYAISIKKPILSLVIPAVVELESRESDYFNKKLTSVQHFIKKIRAYNSYELPHNYMEANNWTVIFESLKLRILGILNNVIKVEPVEVINCINKKYSLNTPSNVLIMDYKDCFQHKCPSSHSNYLLRGNISEMNEISIITQHKEIKETGLKEIQ